MPRTRRGRGEGSIFQRGDGQWCAAFSAGYTSTGKRSRRILYGETKNEVAQKLRSLQQLADAGSLPESRDLTTKVWLERWLKVIEPTVEPATLIPYRRHIERHLVPRIGHVKVQGIRPADVESLFARMLREGVSAAMVRKVGTTLTVALNHAVRSRLITTNPTAGVRKPKAVKKGITVLDVEQAVTLVAAAERERLGALFVLLLDAGLRPGEALALNWPDVDFDRGTVSVTKSLEEIDGAFRVKAPKTKKGVRQVDVTPGTVAAMNRHRASMLRERAGTFEKGWSLPTRRADLFPSPISTGTCSSRC
jgi:integrase